jgi:ubiquinone/menaquinone biosynthesis C-methylase UbiE
VDTPVPSTAFADAWIQVDRTEDPSFYVKLLDATRAELLERARLSPADFFAPLDLQPGHRVLDAGCGTGDLLRILAPLLRSGSAVGIDLSDTMVSEARRRTDSGFANLSFRMADVQELPFDNGSFDRVMATQLLLHVPDPQLALAEMHRVLASGGRISVGEIDWGTVVVESTDRELGRRFTRSACDELRNGLIARELSWRLRESGFEDVRTVARVDVSRDIDAFHRWFIEPAMSHFMRVGAFTQAEADTFIDDLQQRARQGRYFSSRTFYTTIASRA